MSEIGTNVRLRWRAFMAFFDIGGILLLDRTCLRCPRDRNVGYNEMIAIS
jgi:hypothetical protein